MPVSKRISKNYYSFLKHGEPIPEGGLIRHVDRNGNEDFFGEIEGILVGIDLVKDEYEGAVNYKYHFRFEDQDHQQVDILQVGESASASRGILKTLVCCDEPIGWVKVAPYRNESGGKTYTNVWVEVNGHTVDWKDEVNEAIPEVQVTKNAIGEEFTDDSQRRLFFRRIAKNITNNRLAGRIVEEHVDQDTGEVLSAAEHQPEPDGKQLAESMAAEPTSGAKKKAEKGSVQAPPAPDELDSTVDMNDWDDVDDDLPF